MKKGDNKQLYFPLSYIFKIDIKPYPRPPDLEFDLLDEPEEDEEDDDLEERTLPELELLEELPLLIEPDRLELLELLCIEPELLERLEPLLIEPDDLFGLLELPLYTLCGLLLERDGEV